MRMTEIKGIPGAYKLSGVQPEAVVKELESRQSADRQGTSNYSQQSSGKPERVRYPDIDVKDISLTFNKNDDFEYIGKESSLNSLDIEKAISDMKKDKIFEEYQYFIGGKPDLEDDGEADGNVFLK